MQPSCSAHSTAMDHRALDLGNPPTLPLLPLPLLLLQLLVPAAP